MIVKRCTSPFHMQRFVSILIVTKPPVRENAFDAPRPRWGSLRKKHSTVMKNVMKILVIMLSKIWYSYDVLRNYKEQKRVTHTCEKTQHRHSCNHLLENIPTTPVENKSGKESLSTVARISNKIILSYHWDNPNAFNALHTARINHNHVNKIMIFKLCTLPFYNAKICVDFCTKNNMGDIL